MIRRVSIMVVLALALAGGYSAQGQGYVPTPVEVSTSKTTIEGKVYFVHSVLKGQTLYSISKAYGVPVDQINSANPSLKDGLKAGTTIYIPTNQTAPHSYTSTTVKDTLGGKMIRTTTVAVISEATSSEDDSADDSQTQADGKRKKYKKYTVKWYENIYDVAQKFKVPVDALVALNELGENTVLKKRQVLYIPDKNYIREFNKSKKGDNLSTPKKEVGVVEFPADTTKTVQEQQEETTYHAPVYDARERSYKISLVLPFNTTRGADSAATSQMDFYAGSILAFEDYKEDHNGENPYRLNVVDLNDYKSIYTMLASGILDDSELIIGPIFEANISPIAQWANENNTPIISPLDPKATKLAESNPVFFQFPPAQEPLMESTYDGVVSEVLNSHTKPLVIYEKWTSRSRLVNNALNSLYSRGISPDTLSYGILEGRGIDAVMMKAMDTTKVNTIFVVSENEAFVSDVLRNLMLVKGQDSDLEMSLYGLPKWKNFEVIEVSNFHDLDIHIALQYNIDYTLPQTAEFVSDFRFNFRTDPTRYAFQGYDITTCFLEVLDKYGREFPTYMNLYQKSLLQSNVRFEKASSTSGFVNKGVRKIHYTEGWSVKPW